MSIDTLDKKRYTVTPERIEQDPIQVMLHLLEGKAEVAGSNSATNEYIYPILAASYVSREDTPPIEALPKDASIETVGAFTRAIITADQIKPAEAGSEHSQRLTKLFGDVTQNVDPSVVTSVLRAENAVRGDRPNERDLIHAIAREHGISLKGKPVTLTVPVPTKEEIKNATAGFAAAGVLLAGPTLGTAKANAEGGDGGAGTQDTTSQTQDANDGAKVKKVETKGSDPDSKITTVDITNFSGKSGKSDEKDQTPTAAPRQDQDNAQTTATADQQETREPTKVPVKDSQPTTPTATQAPDPTITSRPERTSGPETTQTRTQAQDPTQDPTQTAATDGSRRDDGQEASRGPVPVELPEQKGTEIPGITAAFKDPSVLAKVINPHRLPGTKKIQPPSADAPNESRAKAVQTTTGLPPLTKKEEELLRRSPLFGGLFSRLTQSESEADDSEIPDATEAEPATVVQQEPAELVDAVEQAIKDFSIPGLPKTELQQLLEGTQASTPETSKPIAGKKAMLKAIKLSAKKYKWSVHMRQYFEAAVIAMDQLGIKPTPAMLAAHGGNVGLESSFLPTITEKNPISGRGGLAYYQHTGDRRVALERAATKAGVNLKKDTLKTRVFILKFTIKESRNRVEIDGKGIEWKGFENITLKKAQTAETARRGAWYWRNQFERPRDKPAGRDDRANLAIKLFGQIKYGFNKVKTSRSTNRAAVPEINVGGIAAFKMPDGQAKGHNLRDKYGKGVSGRLPKYELKHLGPGYGPDHYMMKEAADAFKQMNEAMRRDINKTIPINKAAGRTYRPLALQTGSSMSATKGKSRHGDGTAFDGAFFPEIKQNTAQQKQILFWLRDNAWRYGFVQPPWALKGASRKYEVWHWEFWGNKAPAQQLRNIKWYMDGNPRHNDGYKPKAKDVRYLKNHFKK